MTRLPLHPPHSAVEEAARAGFGTALPLRQPAARTTGAGTGALKVAATSWFVVAAVGHAVFLAYVVGFYGAATIRGDFAKWNEVMSHGYVPGEAMGNFVVLVHLAFAGLAISCGLLQLVPKLRQLAPRFHRWNGRVYLLAVLVMSVGGLVMIWTRGAAGSLAQDVSININAFLIIGCAVLAYRHARARRLDLHRRWALRLFVVVSGVWFFRIGLMFWLFVNQGPVGFDPATFRGPAILAIAYGQFLIPLAVLELYFRAQDSRRPATKRAMAAGLGVLALATAIGVFAASMILWLPKL